MDPSKHPYLDTIHERPPASLVEVSDEEYQQNIHDLWNLLQVGIMVGPRNKTRSDGFLNRTPDELLDAKKGLTLHTYQLHAVNEFLRAVLRGERGILLAYGMGIGKTLIVICIIVTLQAHRDHFRQSWSSHESSDFKPGHDVQGKYLLVVPRDLIGHWVRELSIRVSSKLSVIVYHSSSPAWPYTPESLSKADVVVTSNETLRSDHEDAEASETSFRRPHSQQFLGRSPLLAIYWLGVFFDEAHRMNNENTGIAKAAKRLRALTWLPITGTPLQNEYSDIRSMAQLLNVRPLCIPHFFSQYFMLAPPNDLSARLVLSGQLNAVLYLCTRAFTLRLKRHDEFDGTIVLGELDPGVHRHLVHDLRAHEREPQDKVRMQWDKEFRKRQEKRKKRGRRASPDEEDEEIINQKELLNSITYARLAAVHTACPRAGYGDAGDADRELTEAEAHKSVDDLLEEAPAPITFIRSKSHKQKREKFKKSLSNGNWSSSRIDETLEIIQDHLTRRDGKVVVFSEFLCTLDVLVVALLEKLKIASLRFDGTMSQVEIATSVADFEKAEGSPILLITNRSGGLGRSFTDAGLVIHLTPCWNPGLTAQCTDRVIRTPQEKTVYVYHMIASKSIECRVLDIQYEKRGKAVNILDLDPVTEKECRKVAGWQKADLVGLMMAARNLAIEHAEDEAESLRDSFIEPA
ncbi:unnamed protein product [Alternaria alternata]